MRVEPDVLGNVVKLAREKKHLKAEQLAERLEIGERHLSAIETGAGKPGYAVLFQMIRMLDIPADSVFYPEKEIKKEDFKRQQLLRAVQTCSDKTVDILYAACLAAEEK